MAVLPPNLEELMPWDTLQDFINDFTKGVQIIADALDPDVDNSNTSIVIGTQYNSAVFWRVPVKELTDQYNDYYHASGNAPYLLSARLSINSHNATVSDFSRLGKLYSGDWYGFSAAEKEICDELFNNYDFNGKMTVVNENNAAILVSQSMYMAPYLDLNFVPDGYQANTLYYQFTRYNDNINKSNLGVITNTIELTMNEDHPEQYGDIKVVGSNYTAFNTILTKPVAPYKIPFVAVTEDSTVINNYISSNGSDNNYHETTSDGYDVYYGDNYYIIKTNNEPVTYNKVYNTMTATLPDIDPEIHVPTYDENKFGPQPEDIDDDIEVDMPLSDAAFGEGLSHYYVTTVGSTVLNDISAAMSTWDINNTGKDLYRNLLSCRITKVGPIPSESSTFVIYGEELQYNGSPITITKITGNPSMDLGEYEILPKFNDFRDYAPFTKIEMFIPYCGWVSLPSHCMSSEDKPKIITGTLLCDIIAGTCKAVIKCNDTVVAEASGFTAIDVPFTGENVGMKMAGIASSITSYGNQAAKTVGSVASGGMAGGAGAGAALAGGLVGMLGSYAQMYSAFNANYTEICGKTGDGCNVAGLGSVYIKIQRPKAGETEAPYYVPANYAHTTGFMSMKQKQISECSGLIVCANVDTSGISGATARERAEIKRLLETGIYVNLTPPEPPEP